MIYILLKAYFRLSPTPVLHNQAQFVKQACNQTDVIHFSAQLFSLIQWVHMKTWFHSTPLFFPHVLLHYSRHLLEHEIPSEALALLTSILVLRSTQAHPKSFSYKELFWGLFLLSCQLKLNCRIIQTGMFVVHKMGLDTFDQMR